MAEPGSPASQESAPEASAWSCLWGALTSPRETFTILSTRPYWGVALVVLLVLGVAFASLAFGKVSPEEFVHSIEAQGRAVPPQLQDDPERFLGAMRRIQVGAGTIFAAIFYFATAGLFLLLFRMLGSDLRYRQSLSTTVHGLLPLAVSAVAGIVVVLGREEVGMTELQSGTLLLSNLGFLATDETGKAARALLASLDVFAVWSAWLLATGYRVVARVSAGAAWGVVAALWACGIGLKVLAASLF